MIFDTELSVALNIAKKAGELHLDLQPNLNVEHKDDSSPVTEIDKKCEHLIRKQLLETFPDDGFLGKEPEITKEIMIENGLSIRWMAHVLLFEIFQPIVF